MNWYLNAAKLMFILLDYPNLSIAMARSWSISPGQNNSVSHSNYILDIFTNLYHYIGPCLVLEFPVNPSNL